MGTEQDKTNAAVVGTMLALGAAAMIGGSAALVALARGEIRDFSEEAQGFANLSSVHELKDAQRARLNTAKTPINKAKSDVVELLQRNPSLASPPLPEPVASETPVNPSAAPSDSAAPVDSAAPGASAAPSGSAAPQAPAHSGSSAPEPEEAPKDEPPAHEHAPKTPTGTPAASGTH